jgi:hypothetical protein
MTTAMQPAMLYMPTTERSNSRIIMVRPSPSATRPIVANVSRLDAAVARVRKSCGSMSARPTMQAARISSGRRWGSS